MRSDLEATAPRVDQPIDMETEGAVSLEDKYEVGSARAMMNGRQALVRMLLEQREADRRIGLDSAGFVSGYRGSPLGGFDAELWRARESLEAVNIIFQPGLNEELAMTAVAGTQHLDFVGGQKVDGVFGLWYAKGPGVDRAGDAIKHANLCGTAAKGGVVLAFGDDHGGKSSTTAHQSDLTLASWGVPILYPSTVAEIVELGLAAFALSRYAGTVVGLKLGNETAEGAGIVHAGHEKAFRFPEQGSGSDPVNIRREVMAVTAQDTRLVRYKLPRAAAFARANRLDRISFGAQAPRFLIATAGKAYADLLSALDLLGLDATRAEAASIGVYKIAMIYPLDAEGLVEVAREADEIFFIEEKRAHLEVQAKQILYGAARRPRISGKVDPEGRPLLAEDHVLEAVGVALALAERLKAAGYESELPGLFMAVDDLRAARGEKVAMPAAFRRPGFCPGCPHNGSTKVPDGSIGAAGIGCHAMVSFHSDKYPLPLGQMGGEGANWIGLAPFTRVPHIFQNLGDGTYSHSGSLAIRAAVAAGTNITYKILYNDAVAMTGGQPIEGGLTVERIAAQVAAEGVSRLVILSENPTRFDVSLLPPGTVVRSRDDLPLVQDELRAQRGVSIIIYDQVCAAEKRRRRKSRAFPDPDRRVFINSAVCEGCGDCSQQSNCLAIQPLETEQGRKRRIDQSACNKDFSCIKGFCPSFVILEGAKPRTRVPTGQTATSVPEPPLPTLGDGFDMIVAGVGGTGIVTIGALIGMAARIEGYGANLYDMTGLSQKGGTVFSHIRLRPTAGTVVAARIGPSEADMLLACDIIAGAHPEAAGAIRRGHTLVAANSDTSATADFQVNRDIEIPKDALIHQLEERAGADAKLLGATRLAETLLGDGIAANIVMLGFAWQTGRIPLTLRAIEEAIRLNGRAVEANLKAFHAGREAAHSGEGRAETPPMLDAFIARRAEELEGYWDKRYADRYRAVLEGFVAAAPGGGATEEDTWVVARAAYRLMAYKDEYEVARLYSDGRFRRDLESQFEGIRKVRLELSPPILARIDPRTGRPRKISVGGWVLPVLGLLARFRRLRESPFDLFGRTEERKLERQLRDSYLALVERVAARPSAEAVAAVAAASKAAMEVRGFGPVKIPGAKRLALELEEAVARL